MELTRDEIDHCWKNLLGDRYYSEWPSEADRLHFYIEALRQSRDELIKEREREKEVMAQLREAEHKSEMKLLADLHDLQKSRDEYQAKYTKECQDSDELLVQRNEWQAKCEKLCHEHGNLLIRHHDLEQQLAQATARVKELEAYHYDRIAMTDTGSKNQALQQRVAELEKAENDRVNMGMVLGGMASGAIEAERRENAALKQRVASLEGALRGLLDAWKIKKEPSAGNALLWMQNMSTALKHAEHALEGKPL